MVKWLLLLRVLSFPVREYTKVEQTTANTGTKKSFGKANNYDKVFYFSEYIHKTLDKITPPTSLRHHHSLSNTYRQMARQTATLAAHRELLSQMFLYLMDVFLSESYTHLSLS